MDISLRSAGRKFVRPLAMVAVALFPLGACSVTFSGPAAVRDTTGPNRVSISGFQFKPSQLKVGVGASVTWTQNDQTLHTVTSGISDPPDSAGRSQTHLDGRFDSGDLGQGKQFGYTFDRSGDYSYFCSRHPEGMRGEIVVK